MLPNEVDQENQKFAEAQMEAAKKGSRANHDFFDAALRARRSVLADELLPYRDVDGELEYLPEQGYKAACYAREDVAAVVIIQKNILERLDEIKLILWIGIALLVYISYKVT